MALTERTLAEIVRQRLGLPDGKKMPMIISAIPEALKLMGRKVAADSSTRELLITDKTATANKLALDGDGRVDLLAYYDTAYIIEEFLDIGKIYLLAVVTFLNSAVDVTADTINITAPGRLAVGDKVQFTTSGSLPGGLSLATNYYVRTVSGTLQTRNGTYCTITLSSTSDLATTIDLTSQGSGTHTITVQETRDTPLQKLGGRTGAGGQDLESYARQFDSLFRFYYIQGSKLQVLPQGVVGSAAFAVPYYPPSVYSVPTQLEPTLIDTLVKLVKGIPEAV